MEDDNFYAEANTSLVRNSRFFFVYTVHRTKNDIKKTTFLDNSIHRR